MNHARMNLTSGTFVLTNIRVIDFNVSECVSVFFIIDFTSPNLFFLTIPRRTFQLDSIQSSLYLVPNLLSFAIRMDFSKPQIKIEEHNINREGHLPRPTNPTTKALSDGSRDETPSPTYKHSWTTEQRVTLAILAETYRNTWKEITAVFNYVHRSDLPRRGGLRSVVVSTQYNDMLRRKFDVTVALERLQADLPPHNMPNFVTRSQIEQKADEINIKLITDTSMDCSRRTLLDMHNPSARKRKRVDDDARTDYLPDRTHNAYQTASYLRTAHGLAILPKTPQKSSYKNLANGLQTPPDSRGHILPRLTTAKRLAKIGFRAITSQSQGTYDAALGIRAGAFLQSLNIPLARDLEVNRYREEAL